MKNSLVWYVSGVYLTSIYLELAIWIEHYWQQLGILEMQRWLGILGVWQQVGMWKLGCKLGLQQPKRQYLWHRVLLGSSKMGVLMISGVHWTTRRH